MIDAFPKDSVLIGATNQIQLIDEALLRRFDLKLEFTTPPNSVLDGFYDKLLSKYPEKYRIIDRVYDISFADAQNLVFSRVKKNIISQEVKK